MKGFLLAMFCFCACVLRAQSNVEIRNNTEKNEITPQNNVNNTNPNGYLREENQEQVPAVEEENIELKEEQTSGKKVKSKAPVSGESQSAGEKFSVQRKMATTQMTSRSPSPVQQYEIDQAVGYYQSSDPESFEYHFFAYVAGNYDISLYPHLEKAKELRPRNSDVLVQLAAYHWITNRPQESRNELDQLVEIGKIAPEVLSYDQDLLNSVAPNSVLVMHGFDDMYGSAYLQVNKGLRPDVKLISLDFMQSSAYRDSLEKDGFSVPDTRAVDTTFLRDFCALNEDKNLYLSLTFPKPYYGTMIDKLQVSGLAFRYGGTQQPAFSFNEDLWNGIIGARFINEATTQKAKQLSANYLPMLFFLRENYRAVGDGEAIRRIDEAIDRVGVQSNKYSKVNSMRGIR